MATPVRRRLYCKFLFLLVISFFLIILIKLEINAPRNEQRNDNHLSKVKRAGDLDKQVTIRGNVKNEVQAAIDEGYKLYKFNNYVSDLISVRRPLPDQRHESCKEPGRYLNNLPQTSVVICFYNEAWSVLLRTVHSVLDRSPPHLLKEVILVDDASNMTHLMKKLDYYISTLPKVRVVRTYKRLGIVGARLIGLQRVTAPVVTYLDSHCECTEGWLEPLLDRIARDNTTVVSPNIDAIDDETFEYYSTPEILIGGFEWNLDFEWQHLSNERKEKHKDPVDPIKSPTLSGGLFTIDKYFFKRLGTYDTDLKVWGSENLELSFKTWMCGGTLEIIPCSHVGHLFRKTSPHLSKVDEDILYRNKIRLAEVWLDDYKKIFYERIGTFDKGDYGNVSSRIELRKKLQCKSFDWYLKNVYPEKIIPEEPIASGQIRSLGFRKYCLDSFSDNHLDIVGLYPCHQKEADQFWLYTQSRQIRQRDICLEYEDKVDSEIRKGRCQSAKKSQQWVYLWTTKSLIQSDTSLCMAATENKQTIVMEECYAMKLQQQWDMQNFNPEKFGRRRTKFNE